jgi:hypothetical protein
VYVTGQNLFTITGYSGFDPEVNSWLRYALRRPRHRRFSARLRLEHRVGPATLIGLAADAHSRLHAYSENGTRTNRNDHEKITAACTADSPAGSRRLRRHADGNAEDITTGNYYRTPADIETAVLAAYQPITRGDVWEWNLVLLTELASDQVRIHPDEPNFGTYAPGLLAFTPSLGAVVGPWNGFYRSIFFANIVLERAPAAHFTDTEWQKQLIAEAKFIRSYAYLILTKLYGDVPRCCSRSTTTAMRSARRVTR